MSTAAIITLVTLVSFLGLSLSGKVAVDIALFIAMTALLLFGVLTPTEAFLGFANPALFVIACFYIVSAAIKESGALTWWIMKLLGTESRLRKILPRMILAVSSTSSVISNTPVVAIFIPQIQDWARRHKVAVSRLMLPLSYAAILGGTCTLIGTSTNILLIGMMQGLPEVNELHLFSPAVIGLPLIALVIIYFLVLGPRLLPSRQGVSDVVKDAREYAMTMQVDPNGPLAGKTIAEAGLRHMQHCFLSEIQMDNRIIPAVGPDEVIHGGDTLVFVGQPDAVGELRQIRGLIPAERHVHKLDVPYSSRSLVEAVIAPASTLVGKNIKQSKFRTQFGGAILAVSRNGEKINRKVGDIVLKPGDTLLIEASNDFVKRHRYRRDFLLLSRLDDSTLPNREKAPIALALLGGFILLTVTGTLPLVTASLLLVCGLGVTGCISLEYAQRSIDIRVLMAIGASLALGFALQKTGLATLAADTIMDVGGDNPYLNLFLLYVVTVIATELITNNAAVVLMFPIATALSSSLEASLLPFVVAIMFGASMSFMTPFGYQTNLMVQGPGGYHSVDYLKAGSLLSILAAAVVLILTPLIWPFWP